MQESELESLSSFGRPFVHSNPSPCCPEAGVQCRIHPPVKADPTIWPHEAGDSIERDPTFSIRSELAASGRPKTAGKDFSSRSGRKSESWSCAENRKVGIFERKGAAAGAAARRPRRNEREDSEINTRASVLAA